MASGGGPPDRPDANGPARQEVPVAVGEATLRFKVADDPAGSVFFCLGVRKSGSSMFNRLVGFLAQRNRVNVVDVPGAFFRQGFTVADWSALDLALLLRPGNLYAGFRNFPERMAETEAFRAARKVFMFRDPRDALVSQYFSDAYSHSLPSATGVAAAEGLQAFERKRAEALASEIDEWVVKKAGGLRRTMMGYTAMLADPGCLTLRYEDYVFQKRRLAHKVAGHFGWSVPPQPLEAFMAEIDIVPEGEDNTRFIRRAVPGDHRAKLRPETVRRLSRQLQDVLETYDYY